MSSLGELYGECKDRRPIGMTNQIELATNFVNFATYKLPEE